MQAIMFTNSTVNCIIDQTVKKRQKVGAYVL